MALYNEKRAYARYDEDTAIIYAFQDSDQFKKARYATIARAGCVLKHAMHLSRVQTSTL